MIIRRVVLLAAVVSLAGCASALGGGYATYKGSTVEEASVLIGKVTKENGCLYFTQNGTKHLAYFPVDDTSLDGGTLTINGNEYTLGEESYTFSGTKGTKSSALNVPDTCDTSLPAMTLS